MREETLPRFHVCMPFARGSPCLLSVFSGGHSLLHPFVWVKGGCPGELAEIMCMRVVTYNVLSARRAYRLRDISHEIDAHIVGLTGTRLPFLPPVGWLCAQICRHPPWATFRDNMGARADEILEHGCNGVDSREQETLAAKARGEDVRRSSEIAGKSRSCQASKLAG